MTRAVPLRRLVQCLDGRRVPLNSEERASLGGQYPYWGANGVVDHIGDFLFDEDVVLLGEDGAPFDDPLRPTAFPVNGRIWVNNHMHVLRPLPGISPRYLAYALNSIDWMQYVTGATRLKLTQDDMLRAQVYMRTSESQQAVADYLDTETARIDALIAKKRRMIELLDERWRSFVDEQTAVGSPTRVRRVTALRTSGPRGWAEHVSDHGQPFIRSGNLSRESIQLQLESLARLNPPDSAESRRSTTKEGDTLIGITGANTGWVGAVGPEAMGGYVSQHVALLRPRGVAARWLTYSIFARRAQEQLLGGQYGGTKTQLGLEDLANLTILLPTIEVQQSIVSRIEEERNRHAELTNHLTAQINLLIEHRQALITAAVTGELDVAKVA